MRRVVFAFLLLNACSGRYEVGSEDLNDAGASSEEIPGGRVGTDGGLTASGGRTNDKPTYGGHGGTAPTAMGGRGGGAAPIATGGRPPSVRPECRWPVVLLPEPEIVPASPDVVWERMTRFLLNDELEPDQPLPEVATPEWAVATAMRLLDEHPNAPVFELLLQNRSINATTSALYGALMLEPSATLRDLLAPAQSSDPNRFGLLTDPALLAQYPTISGRGMMMLTALYCLTIPPEPPGTPDLPDLPGMTRRTQLEQSLITPECAGCHRLLDPPGYSLENFDATGAYRTLDDGLPIDTSGSYTTPGGAELSFTGIRDLAPQLADSCEVAHCMTQQLLIDALTRGASLDSEQVNARADDPSVSELARDFLNGDRTFRDLVRTIVSSRQFLE